MTNFSTGAFSLEKYGCNLTSFARQGMFHPLKGYDAVVSRIFEVLLRKEKSWSHYNPLLIDEDGTLQRQIALEVVRRLAIGDAPDPLPSLQVIAPNLALLCSTASPGLQHDVTGSVPAGAESLAQLLLWPPADTWSSFDPLLPRFAAFFSSVHQAQDQMLLLLTDFHLLVGGELYPGSIDLASLLVPALARREIQLLGTSTLPGYVQSIECFAAIYCRMQGIALLSDEELRRRAVHVQHQCE